MQIESAGPSEYAHTRLTSVVTLGVMPTRGLFNTIVSIARLIFRTVLTLTLLPRCKETPC